MATLIKDINKNLKALPEEFLVEVQHFIEYLKTKTAQNTGSTKPSKEQSSAKKKIFGATKGLFIIPDDFNEPLEDMKDYM